MMKDDKRIKLSKLMSFILRHAPWKFGVEPDEAGFIELDKFLVTIKKIYPWVKKDDIKMVAKLDAKDRFEIRGNKIRARYGHSYEVAIDYKEDKSSKTLYHGTSIKNLEKILKEGIKSMKRQFVHLTIDSEDAYKTALRHDKDVAILLIDANCLRKKGYKIYDAGRVVRLVEYVPPSCIKLP